MAREKCGHLAFPRSVRLQLSSALTVREECVTYDVIHITYFMFMVF